MWIIFYLLEEKVELFAIEKVSRMRTLDFVYRK